jgi:hypothetical protein
LAVALKGFSNIALDFEIEATSLELSTGVTQHIIATQLNGPVPLL